MELPLQMPRHIAIIPDGNMRWAKKNGLSYKDGLTKGAEVIRETMQYAKELGIQYVTAWGLSTENVKSRDKNTVNFILSKAIGVIRKSRNDYLKNGIRFRHIGSLEDLPEALVNEIIALEEATKDCTKYFFNLALNYGGRNEILRAIKKIVQKGYQAKEITEDLFSDMLDTKDIPEPDLIIRTSGEYRTSGFLPWQSTYSEYYFCPKLWPEFTKEDLEKAVEVYANRERRYGGQKQETPV